MHQLNSSNYETVNVITRDGTICMPADKGASLMQYLTTDGAGSHVMITDVHGTQIVVSKHEIKKVQPVIRQKYVDLTKLVIPTTELNDDQRLENLNHIAEMRRKFNSRK